VCRGRGERVEPLWLARPLHFVLVCSPAGVSTADVYRHLTPPARPRSIAPALEALAGGSPAELGRTLFNRLQPVAEALHPALVRVRDALADLGPSLDGHLMSGSGSAYFGLCRDRDAAVDAAQRLHPLGQGCVRVVTCGL
jgi:4-diphosphocytidyl-2-C-methyl-D-erythritol kinase